MINKRKKCYYCGQAVIKGENCPYFANDNNPNQPHMHVQAWWRKDKTTEKYKEYIKNRNKSMKEAARKRLDKLNKTPIKKNM